MDEAKSKIHPSFDKQKYLENYKGEDNEEFAKALIQCSPFVHFCENYSNTKTFNNFKIFTEN